MSAGVRGVGRHPGLAISVYLLRLISMWWGRESPFTSVHAALVSWPEEGPRWRVVRVRMLGTPESVNTPAMTPRRRIVKNGPQARALNVRLGWALTSTTLGQRRGQSMTSPCAGGGPQTSTHVGKVSASGDSSPAAIKMALISSGGSCCRVSRSGIEEVLRIGTYTWETRCVAWCICGRRRSNLSVALEVGRKNDRHGGHSRRMCSISGE